MRLLIKFGKIQKFLLQWIVFHSAASKKERANSSSLKREVRLITVISSHPETGNPQ